MGFGEFEYEEMKYWLSSISIHKRTIQREGKTYMERVCVCLHLCCSSLYHCSQEMNREIRNPRYKLKWTQIFNLNVGRSSCMVGAYFHGFQSRSKDSLNRLDLEKQVGRMWNRQRAGCLISWPPHLVQAEGRRKDDSWVSTHEQPHLS